MRCKVTAANAIWPHLTVSIVQPKFVSMWNYRCPSPHPDYEIKPRLSSLIHAVIVSYQSIIISFLELIAFLFAGQVRDPHRDRAWKLLANGKYRSAKIAGKSTIFLTILAICQTCMDFHQAFTRMCIICHEKYVWHLIIGHKCFEWLAQLGRIGKSESLWNIWECRMFCVLRSM